MIPSRLALVLSLTLYGVGVLGAGVAGQGCRPSKTGGSGYGPILPPPQGWVLRLTPQENAWVWTVQAWDTQPQTLHRLLVEAESTPVEDDPELPGGRTGVPPGWQVVVLNGSHAWWSEDRGVPVYAAGQTHVQFRTVWIPLSCDPFAAQGSALGPAYAHELRHAWRAAEGLPVCWIGHDPTNCGLTP